LSAVSKIPNKNFYLIGTVKGDDRALDHELAHAFFWKDEEYRNDMISLVNSIPNKDELLRILKEERGYGKDVLFDEAQAFLSTGLITEISDWQEYTKAFTERFMEQKNTNDSNNPDIRFKIGGSIAKKVKFNIENEENEEDRTTISINGIGEVILVETYPEYEFLEDINNEEEILNELGVSEGDLIGKIEHIEIKDEYKGKGYAKLLMKKAIELAKEKGLMPLYLNASPMGYKGLNIEDLTSFYESLGFEVFLSQGNNNLMILNSKNKYAKGGELTLTSEQVENKLSRKLHWWNDDVVSINGIEYKKVFLRNEYKRL